MGYLKLLSPHFSGNYVVQNLSALADSIVSLKLCDNITVYSESWRKDCGLFQSIVIYLEEEDKHELIAE